MAQSREKSRSLRRRKKRMMSNFMIAWMTIKASKSYKNIMLFKNRRALSQQEGIKRI